MHMPISYGDGTINTEFDERAVVYADLTSLKYARQSRKCMNQIYFRCRCLPGTSAVMSTRGLDLGRGVPATG